MRIFTALDGVVLLLEKDEVGYLKEICRVAQFSEYGAFPSEFAEKIKFALEVSQNLPHI